MSQQASKDAALDSLVLQYLEKKQCVADAQLDPLAIAV